MSLKPQDVLVALKLISIGQKKQWTYSFLSQTLGISASESHACVKRLVSSQLANIDSLNVVRVNNNNLLEFIIAGFKYLIPPDYCGPSTGLLCSLNAFEGLSLTEDSYTNFVWQSGDGADAGSGVVPFYKTIPFAARKDVRLYYLLVLVENIRMTQSGSQIHTSCSNNLTNAFSDSTGISTEKYQFPSQIKITNDYLPARVLGQN